MKCRKALENNLQSFLNFQAVVCKPGHWNRLYVRNARASSRKGLYFLITFELKLCLGPDMRAIYLVFF